MKTLAQAMEDALEQKIALGHFNISDSTQLRAIARAAKDLNVPVIIGISEGESDFLGIHNAVALVRATAQEEGVEMYINADHMHTVENCKAAIDAGFDSVIFDGSRESMEDNIRGTREVVAYAQGKQVIVEAEVGYIGTSSKMLDEIPEDVSGVLPTVEEVRNFVERTGVHAVAPAVGNLHGMLTGRANPALDVGLIRNIRESIGDIGMVLHGGSGLTDEDFTQAINAGMNVVHINTEIRVAYRKGIEKGLEHKEEIAPYRYLHHGQDAVYEVVKKRLELFGNV
tara:strand:+ start:4681 stop:5532 length:852 start_codon:yes stop_codon:yes gene_type:complete